MRKFLLLISCLVAMSACTTNDNYSGSGGMTSYSIKSNAYLYHYENGFTGVDAMGWDPKLQHIWSRAGGAITCKVPYDKEQVLAYLTKKYGYSDIAHDLNGVTFHHLQSKKVSNFCTADRIDEIKKTIANITSKVDNTKTKVSTKKNVEDKHPTLNGLPIKAIYYDSAEVCEQGNNPEYGVYLFILPNNQFVALRTNDKPNYFLSNLAELLTDFPSAEDPIKYTKNNDKISALKIFDNTNNKNFKPHFFYVKYEGSFKNDMLIMRRISWYEKPNREKHGGSSYIWNLKKIRSYQ